MASTLLEFGNAKVEDVSEFSELLRNFLGQMIDKKYWKVNDRNCFGPILYAGNARDPRDGTYSIVIQVWSDHADTLFCIIDEFLRDCKSSLEYKRDDKR